jgi:peptidoglycan/xylan/chitin deacetylase (PgdA/CDA1 family)
MTRSPRACVLLTFDVEDTKSPDALRALTIFLSILEKNRLTAIFFITGEMVNQLKTSVSTVKRLRKHEIGYHTALHSARPTLVERLDLKDFPRAVERSLQIEKRARALPNLRRLFRRDVTKFRAPRMCWNPAHMVALQRLGIRSDFSADFSEKVVQCKGLIFYPLPVWVDNILRPTTWARICGRVARGGVIVVALHPSRILYAGVWDWETLETGIRVLNRQKPYSALGVAVRIVLYQVFFGLIGACSRVGLIETRTDSPDGDVESLNSGSVQLSRVYRAAVYPSMLYTNFLPKHWLSQLETFIRSDKAADPD